jgi:hypothetical protein
MDRRSTSLPFGHLLACVAGLTLVGCVPIPNTVALSPRITGTFLQADGTPVVEQPLVLSVEYSDSACANPALHATTDAAGRFDFPPVRKRERFTVVLFERVLTYHICRGPEPTALMYQKWYLHRVPAVDSLACIATPGAGTETERPIDCIRRIPRRRR